MIKITFFNIPHLSVGRGGEIWETEVIRYLNSTKKFDAKLITTNCCYMYDVKPDFEYKIIPLKKILGLHLYNYDDIKEDIENTDILYYFNSFIGSQIPLLRHIKNIKKIIFGYHAKNDWNIIQKIYYSLLDHKIKNIGYNHVLTQYQYKKLIKKGFKRVFVIPNFVDTSEFKPSNDKDPNLIIAPGVTSKEKGLYTLIKISKYIKNIKIYITGNKPSINLPDNIIYLGKLNREEYKKFLSKSSICILPTYGEMFPITFLECLASGNLIITRDLPVLREVCGNIESVYFAKDNNEFIKGLLTFLNKIKDYEEFNRLSIISRERAKIFDKNKILKQFEEKLCSIAED
ncbi:hypothetical protein YN1_7430 [Nanoarchaeota archaeon]